MKALKEVFCGCSLQPSGAILHNLISLSRKKNSLPENGSRECLKRKAVKQAPPFRSIALSPAQKNQTEAECRRKQEETPLDTCYFETFAGDKRKSRKRNSAPKGESVIISLREDITTICFPATTSSIPKDDLSRHQSTLGQILLQGVSLHTTACTQLA